MNTATMHAASSPRRATKAWLGSASDLGLIAITTAAVALAWWIGGMGRKDLFTAIDHARTEWSRRVPTGPLNRCLQDAVARNPIRFKKGADGVNLLYAAQIRVDPPTFTLSVNREGELHFSSERFLINCLRKEFGFEGSPIRIWLRVRKSRSGPQGVKMRKAIARPRTDGKPNSGKDIPQKGSGYLESPKTRIDKRRSSRS